MENDLFKLFALIELNYSHFDDDLLYETIFKDEIYSIGVVVIVTAILLVRKEYDVVRSEDLNQI